LHRQRSGVDSRLEIFLRVKGARIIHGDTHAHRKWDCRQGEYRCHGSALGRNQAGGESVKS
jgi:hypothetical protein